MYFHPTFVFTWRFFCFYHGKAVREKKTRIFVHNNAYIYDIIYVCTFFGSLPKDAYSAVFFLFFPFFCSFFITYIYIIVDISLVCLDIIWKIDRRAYMSRGIIAVRTCTSASTAPPHISIYSYCMQTKFCLFSLFLQPFVLVHTIRRYLSPLACTFHGIEDSIHLLLLWLFSM